MRRYNKVIIGAVLIIAASFLISCGDPPIGEETEVNVQNYLKVNRYVTEMREEFITEGRITNGFLPSQIDIVQTVEYLYWYACAIAGDPNYAISVTVMYSTDEALLNERNRIKELDGFAEFTNDDFIIIGGKDLFTQLEDFFEPPVQDGSRYIVEYAIVSMEKRTITYSEVCVWENQTINDTIASQLNLVYESIPSSSCLYRKNAINRFTNSSSLFE